MKKHSGHRIMIKDTKNKICNNTVAKSNKLFCGHPAGSRHCACCGPSKCTQLSLNEFKENEKTDS